MAKQRLGKLIRITTKPLRSHEISMRHKELLSKALPTQPSNIFEVPFFCSTTKKWHVLNLNTGSSYSTGYDTEQDALESIVEPVVEGYTKEMERKAATRSQLCWLLTIAPEVTKLIERLVDDRVCNGDMPDPTPKRYRG